MLLRSLVSIFLGVSSLSALGAPAKGTVSFNFSTLQPDEYALFDGSKYTVVKTVEIEGLTLSSNCKDKGGKPSCEAFKALTGDVLGEGAPYSGSPASQLCSEMKGSNLIALDSKKREYNFCQFKDGSLVNSWSAYYKKYPKKEIK